MNISEKINALLEKKAYLIDIFPETVPQKDDNRYFAVEKYFRRNRSELDRKLIKIILKLYCYYDMTVVIQDKVIEAPQAEQLIHLLERCFNGEPGSVCFILNECDTMLTWDSDDLYMTVYNIEGEAKKMIIQLVNAEGLFFCKAPL